MCFSIQLTTQAACQEVISTQLTTQTTTENIDSNRLMTQMACPGNDSDSTNYSSGFQKNKFNSRHKRKVCVTESTHA